MYYQGILVNAGGVVTLGSGISSAYNGRGKPATLDPWPPGHGLAVYGTAILRVDAGETEAELDYNANNGIFVRDSGSLTLTGGASVVARAVWNYHEGLAISQTPVPMPPPNTITALVVEDNGSHGILVNAGSSLKLRNSLTRANKGDGIYILTPQSASSSDDVTHIDLGTDADPGQNSFQPTSGENTLSGICLWLGANANQTLNAVGNSFQGTNCASTPSSLNHSAGVCAPGSDYGIGPGMTNNTINLGKCW
jgi:hypothetical protein